MFDFTIDGTKQSVVVLMLLSSYDIVTIRIHENVVSNRLSDNHELVYDYHIEFTKVHVRLQEQNR